MLSKDFAFTEQEIKFMLLKEPRLFLQGTNLLVFFLVGISLWFLL